MAGVSAPHSPGWRRWPVTAVNPNAPTHVTVAPPGDATTTSNVNAPAGATIANAVTTGTPDGRATVSVKAAGHVVFDTTGWWVPA